jgi:putative peptidoglycan lipid II flippase
MSTKRTLALGASLLLVLNIVSRVTGFVREMVIAKAFGATAIADAYIVATTIPTSIYQIGAYALVAVMVPVFLEYEGQGQVDEAWKISNIVLNTLSAIMIAVVGLGWLFAPWIVSVFAPGFSAETYNLAVHLTRIIMPASLFMTLGALCTGYLNSRNKFAVAAFAPVLNNIFIILSALIFSERSGVFGLAMGTLAGAFMFFVIQIPALFKQGFRYKMEIGFVHPGVRKAFGLMGPVTIGCAINQLYLIIDKVLASGLAEGSISALTYANKVMQLPLNIFVMAVSSAFFPTMSRLAAVNDQKGLAAVLNQGLKIVTIVMIPAAVGLIILRQSIVKVLFERGAFDAMATQMTSVALMFFSIGIVGQAINIMLTRGFFSLHDTKTPVLFTALAAVVNIILSLILRKYLAHGGLALSNSISATTTSLFMFIFLSKRIKGIFDRSYALLFIKSLLCAAIMGFVSYMVWQYSVRLSMVIQLGCSVLAGLTIYGVLMSILEKQSIVEFYKQVRSSKVMSGGPQ